MLDLDFDGGEKTQESKTPGVAAAELPAIEKRPVFEKSDPTRSNGEKTQTHARWAWALGFEYFEGWITGALAWSSVLAVLWLGDWSLAAWFALVALCVILVGSFVQAVRRWGF